MDGRIFSERQPNLDAWFTVACPAHCVSPTSTATAKVFMEGIGLQAMDPRE